MEIHRLSEYTTRQVERSNFRQQAEQTKQAASPKLSADEQRMIKHEFNGSANRVLKLYVANGEVKHEQPSAKGKHVDFTV